MNGRNDEPTETLEPLGTDEWPVTDLYRVDPGPDEAQDEPTVVLASPATGEPRAQRRLPGGGPGLTAAILAALLAIGLGAWLVARDTGESDAATTATASSETTPATPPASGQPDVSSAREVADVVGLRVSTARALLLSAGFEVRVTRKSSEQPPGEVLEQSPSAGLMLEPGRTVTLTLARVAAPVLVRVDVPDVVSMTLAAASAALRRAELRAQIELVASGEKAGTVVEQQPAAGAEVRQGALVILSVARSRPAPVTRVEVPDVVGSTVADARRTLRGLGLRVSVTRVLAEAPAGTVVSQSPSAASAVREGATVRLRVSTGPRSATVPDVVGLDATTARAELEAAGFVVRVAEEPTDDPAAAGVVLSQSPSGGSASDEGAVVTLVIGRYD